jgi:radical SAM-linked protein
VDAESYLRAREVDEVLPWDHLDAGVSREFLLKERHLAYQGRQTPDCREAGCQECGVCAHGDLDLRLAQTPGDKPAARPLAIEPTQPAWYRLTYARLDNSRWLGHLETVTAWYRSLRRSGLPLSFSSGFHPLPRVAFHGALPVGVESLAETLDLELAAPMGECLLVRTINQALPPGMKVLHAGRLPKRLPPPQAARVVYVAESDDEVFHSHLMEAFLAAPEFFVTRRRPKEERQVDLRAQVARLEAADPYQVHLSLLTQEKDNIKITDALAAIFKLTETQARELKILKMQTEK